MIPIAGKTKKGKAMPMMGARDYPTGETMATKMKKMPKGKKKC